MEASTEKAIQVAPGIQGLVLVKPEGIRVIVPMAEVSDTFYAAGYGRTKDDAIEMVLMARKAVLDFIQSEGVMVVRAAMTPVTQVPC